MKNSRRVSKIEILFEISPMRARNVASPDEWDAVALMFAEPVAPFWEDDDDEDEYGRRDPRGRSGVRGTEACLTNQKRLPGGRAS